MGGQFLFFVFQVLKAVRCPNASFLERFCDFSFLKNGGRGRVACDRSAVQYRLRSHDMDSVRFPVFYIQRDSFLSRPFHPEPEGVHLVG